MSATMRATLLSILLVPAFAVAQETPVAEEPQAAAQAAETLAPPADVSTTQGSEAASATTADQDAEAGANEAAPATMNTPPVAPTNGKIGLPEDGKAQIVFFRPSKFTGAAIGFKVREGDTELGKLRSGKYFVANVAPGTHEYTVHSEAKDILTIEVEAGETYYVQGTITMGILAGRPNLSPSDEATFNSMADKLKLAN